MTKTKKCKMRQGHGVSRRPHEVRSVSILVTLHVCSTDGPTSSSIPVPDPEGLAHDNTTSQRG